MFHGCNYRTYVCRHSLRPNISHKCRDPGSNRGPSALQSDALPAELSRQLLMLRSCLGFTQVSYRKRDEGTCPHAYSAQGLHLKTTISYPAIVSTLAQFRPFGGVVDHARGDTVTKRTRCQLTQKGLALRELSGSPKAVTYVRMYACLCALMPVCAYVRA